VAILLVSLVAVLRLAYLIFDCPYDLAPDEAHYWDWSRHLDWSYYSKGPGVAWLIRGSTELFGNSMWAVRLPAVLCGSLTLWGLFELTWRVYGQPRLALGVVLLGLTVPALAVGSLLMTIDAPYVCCWTWSLVVAHAACLPARPQSQLRSLELWALLGLLIGVGILIKYTMVLFVPSLVLYMAMVRWRVIKVANPEARRLASGRCCLLFMACCLLPIAFSLVPILIWNAQHDWVTFRHVSRQAGVQNCSPLYWLGPLEYVGGQFAALFGFWFVWWLAAMVRCAWSVINRQRTTSNELYLWCLSAPMFLLFLAFSFKTRVELNWPVTAYLSGAVLLAGWVARQCSSPVTCWRRISQTSLAAAIVTGLILVVLMHHTEWLYPLVSVVSGSSHTSVDHSPLTTHHSPIRRWDPTCRLRGWQTLTTEVERLRQEMGAAGGEPIIAGSGWVLPGELGFYLPDHPQVCSFALANGGRRSQYDFWRPNPVWDAEQFRGCDVICVGDLSSSVREAFERVEPTIRVTHYERGHAVASWPVTICRGFRGFPQIGTGGY
jgi:hypothetical protein